eukprot:COSAG01_NODE_36624_length_514_cov_36.159036_1_plen_115_part_00
MALPKSKDPDDDLAFPRKLSVYQQHIQSTLAQLKSSEPDMSAKERFTEAVRLWNRSKNIKKTQASIERGRQARKRRAANPLPASEPIEFQTAPRKRTAAATPREDYRNQKKMYC